MILLWVMSCTAKSLCLSTTNTVTPTLFWLLLSCYIISIPSFSANFCLHIWFYSLRDNTVKLCFVFFLTVSTWIAACRSLSLIWISVRACVYHPTCFLAIPSILFFCFTLSVATFYTLLLTCVGLLATLFWVYSCLRIQRLCF